MDGATAGLVSAYITSDELGKYVADEVIGSKVPVEKIEESVEGTYNVCNRISLKIIHRQLMHYTAHADHY